MFTDATLALRGTEKVKHAIYKWIEANKPRRNEKFFSQRELARMLKVDPMTVNKAMIELTNESLLYSIKGKGSFIGPDPAVNKGLRLAFVSPGAHYENPKNNPDNWHLVQRETNSIMHTLRDNDSFSTLIVNPNSCSTNDVMRLSKYDAVFFLGDEEFSQIMGKLIKNGTTVVIDGITGRSHLDCVKIYRPLQQDVKVGINYLIERGYTNIAYIGSSSPDGVLKFSGYRQALEDYGIKFNEELIVSDINHQYEGAKGAAILHNREVKFDAIFADTDLKAVGVIEYMTQVGLKVPEDIGVMGFDGIDQCINAPLYLTSVKPANDLAMANVVRNIRKSDGRLKVFDIPQVLGKVIKNRTVK